MHVLVVAWLCAVTAITAAAPREPCAIAIVVDRARPAGELAAIRRGIDGALAALAADDHIAVIAYSSKPTVIAPLQAVGRRTAIAGALVAGTGNNLVAAIDAARAQLAPTTLECKRAIVITNDTALLGLRPLAEKLRGAGIRVSAIGVAGHNGYTLETIARLGRGRAYHLDDAIGIAAAVASEAAVVVPQPWKTPTAVVFVIDRSHWMAGDKLDRAREIVRAGIEALQADDLVAVTVFDRWPITMAPLQPAANRARIAASTSQVTARGAADVREALAGAQRLLDGGDKVRKHVVLVTDAEAGFDDAHEVARAMWRGGITVSAIAISQSNRWHLEAIAERGRYLVAGDSTVEIRLQLLLGRPLRD